jgi:2-methylisocitrate lyase-like PEP mutase family enzyme
MKNQFEKFHALHYTGEPLLIGNAWNVQSAKVFEKLKFSAIATSSAAVAETLGYSDGEQMAFDDYAFVVKHITRTTSLPVSVDLEAGYGKDAETVAANIRKLAELGVSGVNIEDSTTSNGKRAILEAKPFADLLKKVGQFLKDSNTTMFINVRCDAFLLGLPSPVEEALTRMKLYENAGAHGLFFPFITAIDDIKAITNATNLPVNVMCMPALPDFNALKQAGVKRISMGNFLNKNIYQQMESQTSAILNDRSFSRLFQN